MNKMFIVIIGLTVLIGSAFLYPYLINKEQHNASYISSKYGLLFQYPQNYFVALEQTLDGEREQHAIVLAEDTPAVRELFSNPKSATEGPPTITITIFQNNLDRYTLQSFVDGTNFSNFKLSDGKKTETIVGGEIAWRYRATGLYENDNIVVVRPDYVYMFTAFFNSPEDQILKDFDAVLKTVTFTETTGSTVTSGDNAPPGSIHNLPVPKAVTTVKKHVAEKVGVSEGLVIVLTVYEKNWSDSCLGLGGPSESCLAVITPGYEITVKVRDMEQKYRTNSDGSEIRRER
ncbi:MAG: hypothetical protein NUV49_02845 [Patescibacteria group bacterium]|nr:hypothetical protein [Patescibacteria group bacterium]